MPALQPPIVQEYYGLFSGAKIRSPHLCTAMDSRPCQIVAQIPVCNELLYSVQLELHEYSPGKLGIRALEDVYLKLEGGYEIDQAFRLLCCLLSNHSCIASLCIELRSAFRKYEEMIGSSFRATSSLKSLKLRGNECLKQAVAHNIPFLAGLEELDCGWGEQLHDFIEPLCGILTVSSVLKKLTVKHCKFTTHDALLFWSALSGNSTLTDLSINCSCIVQEDANYIDAFGASLEKIPTLSTLAILWDLRGRSGELKYIISAIGHCRSVIKLSMKEFHVDIEDVQAIENLLTSNCSIRILRMIYCHWSTKPGIPAPSYESTDESDALSPSVRPWLNILRKNRSLEELRINFRAFSQTDCRAFFAELQKSTTLKRVDIEDHGRYFHARGILVSSHPFQNKGGLSATDRPDVIITHCKQLSDVSLVQYDKEDVSWMKMAVRALYQCTHVTTLLIYIPYSESAYAMDELIAGYIKNTHSLKEVRLKWALFPEDAVEPLCKMKIIGALKDNTSLRKLFLQSERFTEDEAILFTTMLRSSCKICHLEIFTSLKSTELLVNGLSPGFSRNYTLASLSCHWRDMPLTRHYCFVMDVVRRNRDLVMRAAHCAVGNDSRRCAEALELVAENPALLEKVCELGSVEEQEAVQTVLNALGTTLGLDGYMRVAGVVKSHVCCSTLNDRRLQLTDVDEYSWRCVRRLLRLSDVSPQAS
ncbi:hypothetical protein HPB48_019318 [Haemaphysalis longicornis]|uniref:Nlr family card domain protein n=1 Tax=Haemaphysalis longicornis TaxID=44386 RepID=A0A9J6GW86_HAELO|nr:hypothetical protein HPB48_019318 [Haemaphysalis longicornis]